MYVNPVEPYPTLFHSNYSFCTWKCQDVVANVTNSFSCNSASYVKSAHQRTTIQSSIILYYVSVNTVLKSKFDNSSCFSMASCVQFAYQHITIQSSPILQFLSVTNIFCQENVSIFFTILQSQNQLNQQMTNLKLANNNPIESHRTLFLSQYSFTTKISISLALVAIKWCLSLSQSSRVPSYTRNCQYVNKFLYPAVAALVALNHLRFLYVILIFQLRSYDSCSFRTIVCLPPIQQ